MGRLDALVLLRGVREVASHADPEAPIQVSQRRFDAARSCSCLYGRLPKARDIAWQLQMPWREVLLLAHSPSSTHAHRVGRAQSQREADWLTTDRVAYVLKLVARRLNVGTLTPQLYRTERERILALNRSRWLHGRPARLPTDEQIRIAMDGDWDAALALAGLAPRTGLGDQGRGKYAATTEDVLNRAYEAHGTELTSKEIWVFVAANGIPYSRERKRRWSECVATWKAQRRARGLGVPDGPPARDHRPDYSRDVGAGRPGERRHPRQHSIEDCLASVIAYLQQLRPGQRSTKLGYQDWARSEPNAPAYSVFDAHGGWGRVRELAIQRITTKQN